MLTTLPEFLDAVNDEDGDYIYSLFEHNCSEDLRAEIMSYVGENNPEPVRFAFITLGHINGIDSLINY